MTAKIAVLVSGGGTNLQALIDAKLKNGKIVQVISSRADAYALQRAANNNIRADIAERKSFNTSLEFESKILSLLDETKPDVIILAGFMHILSADFVNKFKNRIINVHPALIPAFCGKGFYGLKVHEAALNYGVKVTGATVHLVNDVPDGGKILKQQAVKILPGDTPEILQRRVMEEAEWVLLPQAISYIAEDRISVRNGMVYIKE
ncbi:MAG: phosphoribosylglycinamide formyltransferase [Synergistaceae bacterium]|nr:phosphoribosylglycinamide formyltransferase [Synergistaceae bacterium]